MRTLFIIKPDAVKRSVISHIIKKIKNAGLTINEHTVEMFTKASASEFYKEHSGKSFFPELIDYMTSGHSFVYVIEGDDAVNRLRKLVGATDPKDAEDGTIRKEFAVNKTQNSVHSSDSIESAQREIDFFFK